MVSELFRNNVRYTTFDSKFPILAVTKCTLEIRQSLKFPTIKYDATRLNENVKIHLNYYWFFINNKNDETRSFL